MGMIHPVPGIQNGKCESKEWKNPSAFPRFGIRMKNLFLASRSSSPSVQKKEQARDVKVFPMRHDLKVGP